MGDFILFCPSNVYVQKKFYIHEYVLKNNWHHFCCNNLKEIICKEKNVILNPDCEGIKLFVEFDEWCAFCSF